MRYENRDRDQNGARGRQSRGYRDDNRFARDDETRYGSGYGDRDEQRAYGRDDDHRDFDDRWSSFDERARPTDRGESWGRRRDMDFGRRRDFSGDQDEFRDRRYADDGPTYGDDGQSYGIHGAGQDQAYRGSRGRGQQSGMGAMGSGYDSQSGLNQRGSYAQQNYGASGQPWLGEHRGKGPKNYSRSDDRIRDDVNDRLTDDPRIDAAGIEVRAANGEVTLDGFVSTREQRRCAEDCVENISGVKHVQNNLRVRDASGGDANTTKSGGSGKQMN
jgi:osmotically-inducible protein OsmY